MQFYFTPTALPISPPLTCHPPACPIKMEDHICTVWGCQEPRLNSISMFFFLMQSQHTFRSNQSVPWHVDFRLLSLPLPLSLFLRFFPLLYIFPPRTLYTHKEDLVVIALSPVLVCVCVYIAAVCGVRLVSPSPADRLCEDTSTGDWLNNPQQSLSGSILTVSL